MSDDTVKFFRLGKDKSFRVQAITRNHRGIYFTGNMLKKFHAGSADSLISKILIAKTNHPISP